MASWSASLRSRSPTRRFTLWTADMRGGIISEVIVSDVGLFAPSPAPHGLRLALRCRFESRGGQHRMDMQRGGSAVTESMAEPGRDHQRLSRLHPDMRVADPHVGLSGVDGEHLLDGVAVRRRAIARRYQLLENAQAGRAV